MTELQMLSTIVSDTIQGLKNVEIDTSAANAIIAYLSIEKLPLATRKEFDRLAVQHKELPTVDDVLERN